MGTGARGDLRGCGMPARALPASKSGSRGPQGGPAQGQASCLLPMYTPPAKPASAQAVGRYAMQFNWQDGHSGGIYSWEYLRRVCQCRGVHVCGRRDDRRAELGHFNQAHFMWGHCDSHLRRKGLICGLKRLLARCIKGVKGWSVRFALVRKGLLKWLGKPSNQTLNRCASEKTER